MAYWGGSSADCDYAFGTVGSYVFLIKERMFKDAATVLEKSHPEQGIIASLKCLRLIAEEFPKCVSVHFRRKQFEESKIAFSAWYNLVQNKLPVKYKNAILAEAEAEFLLFEQRILTSTG